MHLLVTANSPKVVTDLNRRIFSFDLSLPWDDGHGTPRAGDAVWIGLKSQSEIRLIGRIIISGIEKVDAGMNIFGRREESEYFTRDESSGLVLDIPRIPSWSHNLELINIEEVSEEIHAALEMSLRASWRTKFGAIPGSVMKVCADALPRSTNSFSDATSAVERALRATFPTFELSAEQRDSPSHNPFSHTAHAAVVRMIADGLLEILPGSHSLQHVDIAVRPIEPADLEARSFQPRNASLPSELAAQLVALERAEKRHQQILQDCCHYLAAVGVDPLMTDSFDLTFVNEGNQHICEIKSSTSSNFLAQFEAGVMQLLRYRWALRHIQDNCIFKLIIESPEDATPPNTEFDEFCENLGIRLLYWRATSLESGHVAGLAQS